MLLHPFSPRTKVFKMSLIGRLPSMLMVTNPFHETCHKTIKISHVNYMYTLSTETLLDTIIPIINAMSRSTSQMEAQLESQGGKCSFTTKSMLHLCFYSLWLVNISWPITNILLSFSKSPAYPRNDGQTTTKKIKVGHRKKEREKEIKKERKRDV